MTRQPHLGGFQIASQVTHSHASWRHPASDTGFLSRRLTSPVDVDAILRYSGIPVSLHPA
ncbi:hypothetical protein [Mycolicibacterium sp.]|uniref:hypothetical protein n=1 Tax=Mycolicibacterium sp. TaxID=2320850 RepID=UPI0037C862CE